MSQEIEPTYYASKTMPINEALKCAKKLPLESGIEELELETHLINDSLPHVIGREVTVFSESTYITGFSGIQKVETYDQTFGQTAEFVGFVALSIDTTDENDVAEQKNSNKVFAMTEKGTLINEGKLGVQTVDLRYLFDVDCIKLIFSKDEVALTSSRFADGEATEIFKDLQVVIAKIRSLKNQRNFDTKFALIENWHGQKKSSTIDDVRNLILGVNSSVAYVPQENSLSSRAYAVRDAIFNGIYNGAVMFNPRPDKRGPLVDQKLHFAFYATDGLMDEDEKQFYSPGYVYVPISDKVNLAIANVSV